MIKPKSYWGLGLRDLNNKNWSLLSKWQSRFGEENEALWRRIIVSKYGEGKWGWVPKLVSMYMLLGISGAITGVGSESNVKG